MSTDANQIELLVREVMARLAQPGTAQPGTAQPGTAQLASAITTAVSSPGSEELELMASVISVQSLEGKLKGIKRVRIRPNAVITPAARDVLRDAKVTWVRGVKEGSASSDSAASKERPAALVVLAAEKFVEPLKKQLCPRRALVLRAEGDVDQTVKRMQMAISAGHRLGVVIAENSFELNMAVNRLGFRGARIAGWDDFQFAMKEALPDVWVLDSRQWNVPAIMNICNRIYDDGYWRSRKENR